MDSGEEPLEFHTYVLDARYHLFPNLYLSFLPIKVTLSLWEPYAAL